MNFQSSSPQKTTHEFAFRSRRGKLVDQNIRRDSTGSSAPYPTLQYLCYSKCKRTTAQSDVVNVPMCDMVNSKIHGVDVEDAAVDERATNVLSVRQQERIRNSKSNSERIYCDEEPTLPGYESSREALGLLAESGGRFHPPTHQKKAPASEQNYPFVGGTLLPDTLTRRAQPPWRRYLHARELQVDIPRLEVVSTCASVRRLRAETENSSGNPVVQPPTRRHRKQSAGV